MKKKLNRKYLKFDQTAAHLLVDLFTFVNNINITPDLALRGGVYRELAKADIFTQRGDGWEVGYKLTDKGVVLERKIFVKFEQPIAEIPESQRNPIMVAVMETFLEKGQAMPHVDQISPFCVVLVQNVMPLLLTQRLPDLVSKGPLGPRNKG